MKRYWRKWADASRHARPQTYWIKNIVYPGTSKKPCRVDCEPSKLHLMHDPFSCVLPPGVRTAVVVVIARSCLRHLFFGRLGLLRFGCATYQHRPQNARIYASCLSAGARPVKRQKGMVGEQQDVPASCLARMIAAAFSLAFACSEPDSCKSQRSSNQRQRTQRRNASKLDDKEKTGATYGVCFFLSRRSVHVQWVRLRQTHLAGLILQVLLPSLVALVTTSHLVNFSLSKSQSLLSWSAGL